MFQRRRPMWRGLRWVSGIREWEQATQTRVIECCLTCLPCRNELIINLSWWKKRWVGRDGGNFKSIGCLMCPKHQTWNCMTVQDSVRVSSVSLGVPRYHCASPKNKKQTNTKSMWGAWYGLLGFVLKPLLKFYRGWGRPNDKACLCNSINPSFNKLLWIRWICISSYVVGFQLV